MVYNKKSCFLGPRHSFKKNSTLCVYLKFRAVARSENLGGHIVLGGDNVPPLVEIGLTDLPKSGGAQAPPAPPLATGLACCNQVPSI